MTIARTVASSLLFAKELPAKTKAGATVVAAKSKSFWAEVKAEEARILAERTKA